MTVNEDLLDEAIRHAIVLERFSQNEAKEIADFLDAQVLPDLRAKIEGSLATLKSRGLPKTATLKRLEKLQASLDRTLGSSFDAAFMGISQTLESLGLTESEWTAKTLAKMVPLEDFDFKTPSPEFLRSIVNDFPISGRTLKQRFEDLGSSLSNKAIEQVRIGLAQGETTKQIIGRLSNKGLASTRAQAQAIARTAVNHTTTAAREQTYAENSDVIKAVEIVATLDSRTTEICMNYDGKVFPVNEGPRPPFHFNCRTSTVPVTKGWGELDNDLQAKTPEGKRASMTGEAPGKITYGEWLKKQPKSIQDEALGPARAQLFRDGKIGIKDLVGKYGKPLNLQQLQQKIDVKPKAKPKRIDTPIPQQPIEFPKPLFNPPEPPPPPPPPAAPPIPVMVDVAEDWPAELQTWLVQAVDAKTKGKASKASYWKNKGVPLGLPKKFKVPGSFEELNDVLKKPFSDLAEKLVVKDFDKLAEVFEKHALAAEANNAAQKSYYKKKAKELGYAGEMPLTTGDVQALIPALQQGADALGIKPINLPSTKQKLLDINFEYKAATTPQMRSYYKKKAQKLGFTGDIGNDLEVEAWNPDPIIKPAPPAAPEFEAPAKLKPTPIQYDEIIQASAQGDALDSPTGWADYTDRAKETIEKLASAEKLSDLTRIFEEAYPGKFGQIDMPNTYSPQMLRDILIRHIEIYDGIPDFVEWEGMKVPQLPILNLRSRSKRAYGRVMVNGREMGFPPNHWSAKNFNATTTNQRLSFEGATEKGVLPFKSTNEGHVHTIVHEIGHTLDGMAYGGPLELNAPFDDRIRLLGSLKRFRENDLPEQYLAFKEAAARFKRSPRLRVSNTRKGIDKTGATFVEDWKLSGYAKTKPVEAWAEAFARMVLSDPDDWDDITRLAWAEVVAAHERRNLPLPAFLRKKAGSTAPDGYLDVARWQKIGNQKGSNEGGLFVDPDTGKKFYVKFYDDADHVDNEIVANRLYREMGVNTTKAHHGYANGRYAVVSEWQEGLEQINFDADDVWTKTRAVEGFATDAWLANWDVAGATFDNLLSANGAPIRVDAGGSLLFRAQGARKGSLFGDEVGELTTLRDQYKAPQAAKIYGNLNDEDLIQSISVLESISDEKIDEIVDVYWRAGSADLKDELKRKLKTRRNNLLGQRDKLLEKAQEDFKLALKLKQAREAGVLLTPEQYENAQREWLRNLPANQEEAIVNFTGSTYTDMKRYQRGQFPDAPDEIIRAANDMTTALANGPSYQGDLFRGMEAGGTESWFQPFLREGGRLRIDDLTSTSYEQGAQFSGNVQLYFEKTTRSGVKVDEISAFEREKEVVLRPGTEYTVEEVIRLDSSGYAGNLPQWAKNQLGKLSFGNNRWLIRLREV